MGRSTWRPTTGCAVDRGGLSETSCRWSERRSESWMGRRSLDNTAVLHFAVNRGKNGCVWKLLLHELRGVEDVVSHDFVNATAPDAIALDIELISIHQRTPTRVATFFKQAIQIGGRV